MRTIATITLALTVTAIGCVAPKFLVSIPANSTPLREARYYRTQDAANIIGGAAVDQVLRLVWHGPTDHVGMGDRQIARCDQYSSDPSNPFGAIRCERWRWTDSVAAYTFKWRDGETSPVYRIGTVAALAMIRRQTDKGYRESGALFDVGGALLWEWAHAMVAAIRGHF